MNTNKIYGAPPIDLGKVDISPTEMMFWLYCPIKFPGGDLVIPPNLKQFLPIVHAACDELPLEWSKSYVYLTAKTLYTTPEAPGNRPGWHSDGFLTDDLNFVWSDTNPTVFWIPKRMVSVPADHSTSLAVMDSLAEPDTESHVTYRDKHLLKLDQTVIHKVNLNIKAGMRTFVKVSVSKEKYALKGNSINHALVTGWDLTERGAERNCPIAGSKE